MASAKSGVHELKLQPTKVCKSLIDGEKVIKWDEVSEGACSHVSLVAGLRFTDANLLTVDHAKLVTLVIHLVLATECQDLQIYYSLSCLLN